MNILKDFFISEKIKNKFLKKGFIIKTEKHLSLKNKIRTTWNIYFDKDSFLGKTFCIGGNFEKGLLKFFIKHGIYHFENNGLGFSNKEQKWYGWSHRAIYGFGIGSTCKKGDAHYSPSNLEEFVDSVLNNYFDEEDYEIKRYILEKDKKYIKPGGKIIYNYKLADQPGCTSSKLMTTIVPIPNEFLGKGSWTSKTLEDARQMANDFRRSVC